MLKRPYRAKEFQLAGNTIWNVAGQVIDRISKRSGCDLSFESQADIAKLIEQVLYNADSICSRYNVFGARIFPQRIFDKSANYKREVK